MVFLRRNRYVFSLNWTNEKITLNRSISWKIATVLFVETHLIGRLMCTGLIMTTPWRATKKAWNTSYMTLPKFILVNFTKTFRVKNDSSCDYCTYRLESAKDLVKSAIYMCIFLHLFFHSASLFTLFPLISYFSVFLALIYFSFFWEFSYVKVV